MVRKNSSLVIDGFCDRAKNENIAVVCFYCDYPSQQETTVTNMIGAILTQLGGRGKIPKYLGEAFEEGKKEIGGRRMRPPDVMRILWIATALRPCTLICIHALGP